MSITINLIYKATLGRITGLERDALIVEQALKPYHHKFNHYKITERRFFKKYKIPQSLVSKANAFFKTRIHKFDINIFFERIRPELCELANLNLFIPNQEMFHKSQLPLLRDMDLILCKTRYAERIFQKIANNVEYIGFKSMDRLTKELRKDYNSFLHIAGKSSYRRGTSQILDLWTRHADFPQLNVIAHGFNSEDYTNYPNIKIFNDYIPDQLLKKLQNQAGIHLCLSESEGFGHFIMEGLSCGSCVVTTNGKPMNELVESDRGYLVDCNRIEPEEKKFSEKFFFDPVNLEEKILQILADSDQEKINKSQKARQYFKKNEEIFHSNLIGIINSLIPISKNIVTIE
ncbi:MAG: glycosyltransferase [Okeania sp. SIO2F4]|uniref:glycosyltransferase n=1 Tax=Okeania sp. SIO2F4 TaxID=2607790 RepID=UPI00142C39CE|nr:glycosyltransferase [Okeania sp. SIO2F4]NES06465.1 glycosyltransferase [Okeania sp. SIO2F4]